MSSRAEQRVWRVLVIVGSASAVVIAAFVILIAVGAFDPRPIGELTVRLSLGPRETGPENVALNWQSVPLPDPPYSVRLAAATPNGDADGEYGLVIGDDRQHLTIAVSPLGYAGVWQERDGAVESLFPWQPWPHVQMGEAPNELWLDVHGEGATTFATVRVNRELLWQGAIQPPTGRVGTWLRSYGEPFAADFRLLELFAPSEQR